MRVLEGTRLLLLVLLVWLLVGCSQSDGPDPEPHSAIITAGAAVRLVDEAEANLVLHASNQSFDDGEVRLRIAVDGLTVVDDDFYVGDQHNWVAFPLGLSTGVHEITATTDSGATLRETFRLPAGKARYAVIDHWGKGDSAELTWQFRPQPIGFK